MSWDVVIARFTEGASPFDAPRSRSRIPVGALEEVQSRVKNQLPELDARIGTRIWQ